MKKLLALSILILSGCSFSINLGDQVSVDEVDETEPTPDALEELMPMPPTDWAFLEESEETLSFSTGIQNPTSGNLLRAYLVVPNTEEESYPTAMLIPGGTDYGTNAYGTPDETTEELIENGIAYAYFDPDGRGESEGIDDANGFIHQDGLLAISQALTDHSSVNTEELGLVSMSYGTTLASGMLGRYPDEQPYKWYIDWEGPSAREYTTLGCNPDNKGVDKLLRVSCAEEDFWLERESVTYLPSVNIPYLRLQNAIDHKQESNDHAIDAVNAAMEGNSPWVRINNEHPNQVYTDENQPEYPKKTVVSYHILEMFDLF